MGDRPHEFDESDRAALEHAKAELAEAKHRAWLWAIVKRGAIWTTGLVGGVTLAADGIAKLVKFLRELIQ